MSTITPMIQPDFFKPESRHYQWEGRQVFVELRNDARFQRTLHRVVYCLQDSCDASNESTARAIFREHFPDAQTIGVHEV